MKYSISNIAWSAEYDNEMYAFLKKQGIDGIEIAPTRLFVNPYDNLELAHEYAWMLKNKYGLTVSSMQSIWYGIKESIFGTEEEKNKSIEAIRKAYEYAEKIDEADNLIANHIGEGIFNKEGWQYILDRI